jgi:hypothetical protein
MDEDVASDVTLQWRKAFAGLLGGRMGQHSVFCSRNSLCEFGSLQLLTIRTTLS